MIGFENFVFLVMNIIRLQCVMFLSLALGHLRGNGVVLCENISLSSVSDIYREYLTVI
jgi:hypothetical protein